MSPYQRAIAERSQHQVASASRIEYRELFAQEDPDQRGPVLVVPWWVKIGICPADECAGLVDAEAPGVMFGSQDQHNAPGLFLNTIFRWRTSLSRRPDAHQLRSLDPRLVPLSIGPSEMTGTTSL